MIVYFTSINNCKYTVSIKKNYFLWSFYKIFHMRPFSSSALIEQKLFLLVFNGLLKHFFLLSIFKSCLWILSLFSLTFISLWKSYISVNSFPVSLFNEFSSICFGANAYLTDLTFFRLNVAFLLNHLVLYVFYCIFSFIYF